MILIMMGYGERFTSPCRQQYDNFSLVIPRELPFTLHLTLLRALQTVLCIAIHNLRNCPSVSEAIARVRLDLYYGQLTTNRTRNKGLRTSYVMTNFRGFYHVG